MTARTGTGSPVTWTERVPQTTVTGTTIADGGFGFVAPASGTSDDAKIGLDADADGVIDTGEIIYDEDFETSGFTATGGDSAVRR